MVPAVPALPNAERFELAVAYVRDGGAKEQLAGRNPFSTDELLKFYGWYKQATQGDCSTPQPRRNCWSSLSLTVRGRPDRNTDVGRAASAGGATRFRGASSAARASGS